MNRIYIPVGGRLGNQLFYYGFGRWLQIKYFPDHVLCFDFSHVYKQGSHYQYDPKYWQNSLDLFRTSQFEVYSKDFVVYREGAAFQKILAALIKKLKNNRNLSDHEIELFSKIGLVYNCRPGLENVYSFDKTYRKDIFVRGVLESDYYLNQIRKELLEEIVPKEERKIENIKLYDIIENSESVCVSVRRGDYVTNPELNYRNICNKDYFNKAISKITRILNDPVIIFSRTTLHGVEKTLMEN